MKPILGREGRAALAGCRERGALLAFDFDGTLAPIVADPALAALRPSTRRLLARLARRSTCVVLSGRAVDDVAARLAGVGIVHVVGNHGAAFALTPSARAAARSRAARWLARLSAALEGRPGLRLEDNGLSLAVHYRRAPDPQAARRAIRRAARALPGVRLLDGKRVVNVLPARAPHKGAVLAALARRLRAHCVLFLGDDLTDEAAFATPVAPAYVTVRVGRSRASAAAFVLSSQREVDALLRELLRSPRRPARAAGRLSASPRRARRSP